MIDSLERERESVCVSVCLSVCVFVRACAFERVVCARAGKLAYVCVCVRERERVPPRLSTFIFVIAYC